MTLLHRFTGSLLISIKFFYKRQYFGKFTKGLEFFFTLYIHVVRQQISLHCLENCKIGLMKFNRLVYFVKNCPIIWLKRCCHFLFV